MISRFFVMRMVLVLILLISLPANSYATHLDSQTPPRSQAINLSPEAQAVLSHPPRRLSRQVKEELADVLKRAAEPVLRSYLKNRFDKLSFTVSSAQLRSGTAIHFSAQGISADHPHTKIVLEVFFKGGNQAVDEFYGRWFDPTTDRDGWIRRYRFPTADRAAHTNLKDEETEAFYWQKKEYYVEVWAARQVKVFAQEVHATVSTKGFYEFANSLLASSGGRSRPGGKTSRAQRLMKAVQDGNLDRVNRSIRRGVDLKGTPGEMTALILASELGHTEILDALIKAGADVNVRGPNGASALFKAVEKNRALIVRKLIVAGSQVPYKDDKGATLLAVAAKNGNADILRALLRAGADVNGSRLYLNDSPVYRTPLMAAAEFGQIIAAIVLLNSKADPDLHGERGVTPLMIAAGSGHRDIVIALLSVGADRRIRDDDNRTARTIAEAKGHENIIILFENLSRERRLGHDRQGRFDRHSAPDNSRTGSFAANRYQPRDRALVQKDLIATGKNGDARNLFDLIDADKGDINGTDSGGNSPLMFAAFHGHGAMVNTLLNETSADVNWTNKDGNSALLYAAQKGDDWMVNTLILAGAKINHKNRKGKTALNYAVEQGHSDVILTLNEAGAH